MNQFHNHNIERAILATIIFEPSTFEDVLQRIEPETFHFPRYRDIFSIMTKLDKTKGIDEEFIKVELEKSGKWDEEQFFEIMATTPVSNITPYLGELKAYENKRKLYNLTLTIREKLKEDEDVEKILFEVESLKENISSDFSLVGETLDEIEAKDPEFILKDFVPLPVGTISLISAPGGTGKSWLALQLALRYAKDNPAKKVFLWLSEDNNSISKGRAIHIWNKVLGLSGSLPKNIVLYDKAPPILLQRSRGTLSISPDFYKIKHSLKEYDFIVFDPLLGFYGGDENDNSQARTFMQPFMNWASEKQISIAFLHHSTKPDESGFSKSRGASAFVDAVRISYEMQKIGRLEAKKFVPLKEKAHDRELIITKDNYGAIKYIGSFKKEIQITESKQAKEVVIEYKDTKLELPPI